MVGGEGFVSQVALPELGLWSKGGEKRTPFSFDLEVTARCNNDCRHCYINLPAGDRAAQGKELSLDEIEGIAGQAVELGALWCLVTGGEPLLRQDFSEVYRMLKRKGLLVSVFSNACLVSEEHVRLFQAYPPRDVEVSVYGVTEETYERVTRKPGSYAAFRQGLERLAGGGVKVRLKAVALRSNAGEFAEIARFCREMTADYFRFDPLLHLRCDGDEKRNAEIRAERLSGEEIAALEQADAERARALQRECGSLPDGEVDGGRCNHLFHCGAGKYSFSVGQDGTFRLCSSLTQPDCAYDLRTGNLREAWEQWVPRVRDMRSDRPAFLEGCRTCSLVNLCLWCPANAYLECGEMDGRSEYFCEVARARERGIQEKNHHEGHEVTVNR
jgi:radical SAM protein with 4Fe4S-binding SPASM domain